MFKSEYGFFSLIWNINCFTLKAYLTKDCTFFEAKMIVNYIKLNIENSNANQSNDVSKFDIFISISSTDRLCSATVSCMFSKCNNILCISIFACFLVVVVLMMMCTFLVGVYKFFILFVLKLDNQFKWLFCKWF